MCTLAGKLCQSEYPIPIKADWSDHLEEERETQEQNKDKDNVSDIEDWDGDLEKTEKIQSAITKEQ